MVIYAHVLVVFLVVPSTFSVIHGEIHIKEVALFSLKLKRINQFQCSDVDVAMSLLNTLSRNFGSR